MKQSMENRYSKIQKNVDVNHMLTDHFYSFCLITRVFKGLQFERKQSLLAQLVQKLCKFEVNFELVYCHAFSEVAVFIFSYIFTKTASLFGNHRNPLIKSRFFCFTMENNNFIIYQEIWIFYMVQEGRHRAIFIDARAPNF